MALPAFAESMTMIDPYDASHDRRRLAMARGLSLYDEAQLLDCLEDADPILRTAAARQLHLRGTRATFERALKLLDHPRFDHREIGIFVLGQLGTPDCPYAAETFKRMPKLLDDAYAEVRAAAAAAIGSLSSLGHCPPGSSFASLVSLEDDVSADVRASVAFALGMLDDPAATRIVGKLCDDPDPDVRDVAETSAEWQKERDADPSRTAPVSARRKVRFPKPPAQARTSHG